MDWAGRRRRHTDKRSYRSEAITPADAAWLLEGAEGIACYGAGTAAFAFLQRGTVEAVTAQSADAAYRGELNRWLRFSNREVEEKRDGISPEMLGLRGVALQPLSAMLEIASYREALERELTAGARAQMLLRAGYVEDYGENAAMRRPLRDYVTVIR